SFLLDFEMKIDGKEDHNEKEIKIINSFIQFLKSPENKFYDLDFFKQYYEGVKSEKKVRKDTIRAYNSGWLMPYPDVFGQRTSMGFESPKKKYFLCDAYCISPQCTCTDVGLYFFDKFYKIGSRYPNFLFVYDYEKGTFKEPVNINEENVQKLIESFDEDLVNEFRKRHKELKKEVGLYILKRLSKKKKTARKKSVSHDIKIGRNEPCPCGSGKKYKKCCLEL
ncbi:MAG: SEC-C domain-containing protein, partial [Nanoarchaeota archaeon]|nr:SEC-C domain-containing protein [Nanoarchaeota archaeon]